jgi:hypothetical protein
MNPQDDDDDGLDDERRLDEIERQQLDDHDREFGPDYFLSLVRAEAQREAWAVGADFAGQFAAGKQAVARLEESAE